MSCKGKSWSYDYDHDYFSGIGYWDPSLWKFSGVPLMILRWFHWYPIRVRSANLPNSLGSKKCYVGDRFSVRARDRVRLRTRRPISFLLFSIKIAFNFYIFFFFIIAGFKIPQMTQCAQIGAIEINHTCVVQLCSCTYEWNFKTHTYNSSPFPTISRCVLRDLYCTNTIEQI